MDSISISKRNLKNVVRESVREILNEELITLRATLVPFVSDSEQKDIERLYKTPSRRMAKVRKFIV